MLKSVAGGATNKHVRRFVSTATALLVITGSFYPHRTLYLQVYAKTMDAPADGARLRQCVCYHA